MIRYDTSLRKIQDKKKASTSLCWLVSFSHYASTGDA